MRVFAAVDTFVDHPFRADARDYVSYAYHLHHHGVYSRQPLFLTAPSLHPDALRVPGYPLFLVAFIDSTPDLRFIERVSIAQALLGVLAVVLTFFLARQLVGPALALAPTMLIAVSPHHISFATLLLSESLFTFLLLLGVGSVVLAILHPRHMLSMGIAAGVLFGCCALVRPTIQYVWVIALFAPLVLPRRGTVVKWAAMFIMGFALAFGPWIIRNYISVGVAGDPTLTISTILDGSYPDFMYQGRPETLYHPYRFDPHAGEYGGSLRAVIAHLLNEFWAHPARMLRWYLIGKPLNFFSWYVGDNPHPFLQYPVIMSPYVQGDLLFSATALGSRLLHPILIVLGCAGSLLVWLPNAARWGISEPAQRIGRVCSILIAYFLAVHVVGEPLGRYSVPLTPILYSMAFVAILWRASRLSSRLETGGA